MSVCHSDTRCSHNTLISATKFLHLQNVSMSVTVGRMLMLAVHFCQSCVSPFSALSIMTCHAFSLMSIEPATG